MPRSARALSGARLVLAIACLIAAGMARADEPKTWRLISDAPAFPPALAVPFGVYDPVRHRVLAIDADYTDTKPLVVHVFDRSPSPHWTTIDAVGTPPEQFFLSNLVHDPVRDRLIVVGSDSGVGIEVWALTLSGTPTWQRLDSGGATPPARGGHSLVYDPAHDRVILFGGDGSTYLSDVWAFSLTTNQWKLLLSPFGAGPLGREGHGAIYDPVGQRMIVFGGHYEDTARHFLNDVWALSLGDVVAWQELSPAGPIPGARSAFGAVYDPVRHRLLVHGGINDQSGLEPDNLWALALDGTPTWSQIQTQDTLRGRSYPIDVYDPVLDALLACGGGGYPQTSELSLATPTRWSAVLPERPLPAPGPRSRHAVVHDTRRDRFVVVGGDYSSADSAMWSFDAESVSPWQPTSAPASPGGWFEQWQATVYDSLGDRFLVFSGGNTGGQVYSSPATGPRVWTPLGPPAPLGPPYGSDPADVAMGASVTLDSFRNQLIVSGGWVPYPHTGDYTVSGVKALSLGPDPTWHFLGRLPQPLGAREHASYYDPVGDRLVITGGFERDGHLTRFLIGGQVWASPLGSELHWTQLNSTSGVLPPGPPAAHTAFDAAGGRLFIASDSTVWTRLVDDTGPWTQLEFTGDRPTMPSAIVYDSPRGQLLALFASEGGTDHIQTWALATGSLSVSLFDAHRSDRAVDLRWRSVTAFGHTATLERREESTDWAALGPIEFDVRGSGTFTDQDVRHGHDYSYRVSVLNGVATYHSPSIFIPDPSDVRLALLGTRPNPAVGELQLEFSLPGTGPAQLEVYDVRGRRCLSREVGSLGPGLHSLPLEASASLRPGVYYAKLRRGSESCVARVVLVR